MGDLISLRPITLPVLCPRFDQVRLFRMRTRAHPRDGRTQTFAHGLIQIGTLQRPEVSTVGALIKVGLTYCKEISNPSQKWMILIQSHSAPSHLVCRNVECSFSFLESRFLHTTSRLKFVELVPGLKLDYFLHSFPEVSPNVERSPSGGIFAAVGLHNSVFAYGISNTAQWFQKGVAESRRNEIRNEAIEENSVLNLTDSTD
eukprot:gene17512-biopygen5018